VTPVGRLHHVIVDCRDPLQEATFWSAVLGQPVTYRSDDFAVVAESDHHSGLGFQLAPDHEPPAWPAPGQQLHLDVMVDDLATAAAAVEALGARPLGGDHVYADPAGHPFCLIPRPSWAPRVGS
jgi:catechol 2,3-dioxygenase-like lactoylglutathione lyase family enzyme